MIAYDESMIDLRPRMISVAQRVLSNQADAEDAVQDAYVRLLQCRGVHSVEGFLFRTTIRRCIDRLRERRARDRHVASWMVVRSNADGSGTTARSEKSLSEAFAFMLERLTPRDVIAYVLRTVFNFEYAHIGAMLNKAEENVRQIHHRANSRLLHGKARFQPPIESASQLAEQFVQASRDGDVTAFVQSMAPYCGKRAIDASASAAHQHSSSAQTRRQREQVERECPTALMPMSEMHPNRAVESRSGGNKWL